MRTLFVLDGAESIAEKEVWVNMPDRVLTGDNLDLKGLIGKKALTKKQLIDVESLCWSVFSAYWERDKEGIYLRVYLEGA